MRRVVGSAGLGGRDESKSPYARLGFITSGRGALNVTCRCRRVTELRRTSNPRVPETIERPRGRPQPSSRSLFHCCRSSTAEVTNLARRRLLAPNGRALSPRGPHRSMQNVPNPIAGFGSGAKLGLCLRLVTNPTSRFGFGTLCMPLGD